MLLEQIHAKYSQMSGSQQKIARYFQQHFDQVVFFSVAELAAKIGTSPATIIRFCNALGYQGFTQMQKELQAAALAQNAQTPRQAPEENGGDGQIAVICREIMAAENVLIIGYMESFGMAGELLNALDTARGNVYMTRLLSTDWSQVVQMMERKTLALTVSFAPHYAYTLDCTKTAKSKGCGVIVFTDSALSPYTALADHSVVFDLEHKIGSPLVNTAPVCAYFYRMLSYLYDHYPNLPAGRPRDPKLFIE